MLYEEGQLIQWRKWIGRIHFAYSGNKTYAVELYNYKGYDTMIRQVDQMELCELK